MAEISLSAFGAKCEKDLDAVVGKVTLDLLKRVVDKTPVDSGVARGGWRLAAGQGAAGGAEETPDPDGRETVAKAAAEALAITAAKGATLYNKVEYIGALENGHSQQAPGGMVGVSIAEVVAAFR